MIPNFAEAIKVVGSSRNHLFFSPSSHFPLRRRPSSFMSALSMGPMARHPFLALTLAALVFAGALAAESDVSVCPLGLETVLASPACSVHRLHLMMAPRTIIHPTSNGDDLCASALRLLLLSAPSLPCAASLTPQPRQQRRPSEADFKCKFEMAASPEPSQSFTVECEEATHLHSHHTWLWSALGICGCVLTLVGLAVAGAEDSPKRLKGHPAGTRFSAKVSPRSIKA
jgi:hypothetical protein